MKVSTTLVALLLLASLTACSNVQVTDYKHIEPKLVLEEFFTGNLSAHGVVKDRNGRVVRLFTASIKTSWEQGVGTLDEDFIFDDGEKQKRVWQLHPQDDGSYTGTAGDVQGEGQLSIAGNSAFLDYVLSVPYGDGTVDVRVDDRMYLVAPGVLINESVMKKLGVRVGSLLLVILQEDST
jgi:hypothetical protein